MGDAQRQRARGPLTHAPFAIATSPHQQSARERCQAAWDPAGVLAVLEYSIHLSLHRTKPQTRTLDVQHAQMLERSLAVELFK